VLEVATEIDAQDENSPFAIAAITRDTRDHGDS
jgi:hypothetical protein